MASEHDELRRRLGTVGAWTFRFDSRPPPAAARDVAAIEAVGYPALWIPEGGGSNDVLTALSWLLGSSEHLTVASGIANISAREPEVLARGAAFLRAASGERLVLGIGVGHSYSTERRGIAWDKPLGADAELSRRDGRRRARAARAEAAGGARRRDAQALGRPGAGCPHLLRPGCAHRSRPWGARA